uniref:Acyl-CoA dehydrogenase family member 9, mitochondrial-like n=1 Tax=Phallusia mammillata TaxID=59560 RepID=A0A6F9D655_9ASCI|nr:acyl-CoA dehydrogenase family member 9, mitochondrial-like [Phallusia mammillata]
MTTSISTCRLLARRLRNGNPRFKGICVRKHDYHPFTSIAVRTIATTKPRNESFARQHATGKIDMSWVFPYPTVGSEEGLNELNDYCKEVKQYLLDNVNSKILDHTGIISDEIMQGLKDLGLFALKVPKTFGGKGLSNLEYYRLLETLSLDSSIVEVIHAHQVPGLQGLMQFGNGDQQHKYLRQLASGKLIATVALEEKASGSDIAAISCKAHLSEDGKHWILNGEKEWVVNGGRANLFTVFAKTEVVDLNDQVVEKTTAFLVEKSFGGVSTDDAANTCGLKAANICTVKFEDTPVPVQNVLGEVGFGFEIAVSFINSKRLSMGPMMAGQLHRAINDVTEITSQRERFGMKVSDCELAQEKIFNMTLDTYMLESMVYMTAGQMDKVDQDGNPEDCSIEAAIVKVFSSKIGWSSFAEYFQLVGLDSCDGGFPYQRLLQDFQVSSILKGSDEVLKMYIGLGCLQHAAKVMEDRIRAAKAGGFREKWTAMWDVSRIQIRILQNKATVIPHPSFGLKGESQTKTWLDKRLNNMGRMIESLTDSYAKRVFEVLREHGKGLENEQVIVGRLAEVAINLYGLTCVLARCNKSQILALRNADHEMLLAFAITKRLYKETHMILDLIGPLKIHGHADAQKKAGREVATERRYLPSHPLEVAHRHEEHPKYLEQKNKILELTN